MSILKKIRQMLTVSKVLSEISENKPVPSFNEATKPETDKKVVVKKKKKTKKNKKTQDSASNEQGC